MIPGMIDAHVHVGQIGFAAMTLDLSGTNAPARRIKPRRGTFQSPFSASPRRDAGR